jgi:hypothetical protein
VVVIDTLIPDLEISLELNAFAPRLARHRLEEVGHLAPDLRDAVSLLSSDLVTRAVRACPSDLGSQAHLSAWIADHFVRVQLQAPHALLPSGPDAGCSPYEKALLDQIADRWSIDDGEQTVCMWFEIDRG